MQGVYLATLDDILASAIVDPIGAEARDIIRGHRVAHGEKEVTPAIGLEQLEKHQLTRVRNDSLIPETQREQIVLARRTRKACSLVRPHPVQIVTLSAPYDCGCFCCI